jgi:hypothetical protein
MGAPGSDARLGQKLEGGNRLCRKFLASIFRHKPKFVPMINEENNFLLNSLNIKFKKWSKQKRQFNYMLL